MRFKKTAEEEPRLGITPLIDIVFLLLIFFMLTSHFHVASGIPIRLPTVAQKAHDSEKRSVSLVIDRKGNLYLKGQKISVEELGSKLKDLSQREDVRQIILEADKSVRHGLVVQVMDLAKTAGIAGLIIAANWEPRRGGI
jgi:biopolymer transport protein ExbD